MSIRTHFAALLSTTVWHCFFQTLRSTPFRDRTWAYHDRLTESALGLNGMVQLNLREAQTSSSSVVLSHSHAPRFGFNKSNTSKVAWSVPSTPSSSPLRTRAPRCELAGPCGRAGRAHHYDARGLRSFLLNATAGSSSYTGGHRQLQQMTKPPHLPQQQPPLVRTLKALFHPRLFRARGAAPHSAPSPHHAAPRPTLPQHASCTRSPLQPAAPCSSFWTRSSPCQLPPSTSGGQPQQIPGQRSRSARKHSPWQSFQLAWTPS